VITRVDVPVLRREGSVPEVLVIDHLNLVAALDHAIECLYRTCPARVDYVSQAVFAAASVEYHEHLEALLTRKQRALVIVREVQQQLAVKRRRLG